MPKSKLKPKKQIRRKKPPLHFLIVDTNCIWHENKELVICPSFEKFWEEYTFNYDLKLVIPEVVYGEILYQQTTSNLKTLERINKQFETLSKVSNKPYSHKISETRVRNDVRDRLDKWMSHVKASREPTPIEKVNWAELIQSSIWRKPPFIDEKDCEKGFRDALILETVRAFCEREKDNEIAFMSLDRVLREASKDQLNYVNFSAYESIEEFASYLKLTGEQLTESFIRSIQKRAKFKFFKSLDYTCLYFTENISDRIKKQFESEFSTAMEDFMSRLQRPLLGEKPLQSSISISDEKRWITPAQFERLEDNDVFYWKSIVTFVELFRAQNKIAVLPDSMTEKRLRVLKFAVHWNAKVTSDGRFRNITLNDITFHSKSFEEPTTNDLENYQIIEREEE